MATTITANGINFPDGSAGSPSIGGTDTNTGLFTGSDIVGFATGGSERLRIDASGNINIANDSGKLQLGTSADLKLFHNGTRSKIENLTGDLRICGNDIKLKNYDDDETYITCVDDGAVELYHNNVKRFETDTDGVRVVAPEGAQAMLRLIGDEGDDNNDYFRLNAGGGTLKLQDASNGSSWEDNIVINAAGSVELYYDNAKKLETWAGGIKLNGVENAGSQILVGASDDFAIEHDGSNTYLANSTGDLVLQNDANVKITAKAGGTQRFRFDTDGLKFGSDTAAANALDDYEEGTFSPFTSTQISDHNITIPAQAHYVKVGRICHVWWRMTYSSSSGTQISGNLPFTGSNPTENGSYSPFFMPVFPKTNGASDMGFCYTGGDGTAGFYFYRNNANYAGYDFNAGTGEFTVSGSYRTT